MHYHAVTSTSIEPLEVSVIQPPTMSQHDTSFRQQWGSRPRSSSSSYLGEYSKGETAEQTIKAEQLETLQASYLTLLTQPGRQRTAIACEKCRSRKTKCSGEKPVCSRCAARGLICSYAGKESRVRGPSKARLRANMTNLQVHEGFRESISPVGPSYSQSRFDTLWKETSGGHRASSVDEQELSTREDILGLTGTYRRPSSMIITGAELDAAMTPKPESAFDPYPVGYVPFGRRECISEPSSATRPNFSMSSKSSYPPRAALSLDHLLQSNTCSNPSSTASSSAGSPHSPSPPSHKWNGSASWTVKSEHGGYDYGTEDRILRSFGPQTYPDESMEYDTQVYAQESQESKRDACDPRGRYFDYGAATHHSIPQNGYSGQYAY